MALQTPLPGGQFPKWLQPLPPQPCSPSSSALRGHGPPPPPPQLSQHRMTEAEFLMQPGAGEDPAPLRGGVPKSSELRYRPSWSPETGPALSAHLHSLGCPQAGLCSPACLLAGHLVLLCRSVGGCEG